MEYLVQTKGLTKKYGHKAAIDDVHLHVKEGEVYGLIGRNGAGKTTIMRILSGLSNATSGSYSLFGKEGKQMREEMCKVGVLIEAPGLYPKLSAYDNLRAKCLAMGKDNKKYIQDLLELVGLSDTGKKKAGSFSLGMRQRLGIALSLIGDPKLIILDEPINGLDPQGIVDVRQMLANLRDERHITIMISSHILDELGKLADSYGIIDRGKLIDEFTTEELHKRSGDFTVVRTDNNEKTLGIIRQMGIGEANIEPEGVIRFRGELDRSHNLVKKLIEQDIFVKEVRIESFSLEEYYLSVTKEGGEQNAESAEDGSVQTQKN